MNGRGTPRPVRAVVFDMDGTLTEPTLDFRRIRREGGVPEDESILAFAARADEAACARCMEVLHRHESHAARHCNLRPEALEVVAALRQRGVRVALLTRNSAASVRTVIRRFMLDLDCWLSREDAEPKPSPQPVMEIARRLKVDPAEVLTVGDYIDDVRAGRAAGTRTALLQPEAGAEHPPEADSVIASLRDVLGLIDASNPGGEPYICD